MKETVEMKEQKRTAKHLSLKRELVTNLALVRINKRSRKSRKKKLKRESTIGKASSESRSKSPSKNDSLSRSQLRTLSPKSMKHKYIVCKDCKRRRVRHKKAAKRLEKVSTQEYLEEKQQKLEQRMKKINSTKIFRSQNSILSKSANEQKTEEDYESDFKIEASLESMDSSSCYSWAYDAEIADHHDFELEYYANNPKELIKDIFRKLDLYAQRKTRESRAQSMNDKLAVLLHSKVSKMQREELELFFMVLFEDIEKRDEIIEMIARGQMQNNVTKKVYKTIIQPKFEVIPFNVRSIENILNRVHSNDRSNSNNRRNLKDVEVQTMDGSDHTEMLQTLKDFQVNFSLKSKMEKTRQKNKDKLMSIKKKINEHDYSIFSTNVEKFILNRSNTSFGKPDDMRVKPRNDDVRNIYSYTSLGKSRPEHGVVNNSDLNSSSRYNKEEMRNYNDGSYLTSTNFMMTGHRFSSTYSGKQNHSPKILPDMPYNNHQEANLSMLDSAKNASSIHERAALKVAEVDTADQQARSVSLTNGRTGHEYKSRNSAVKNVEQKLKTSSWLFSRTGKPQRGEISVQSIRQRKGKNMSQILYKRNSRGKSTFKD